MANWKRCYEDDRNHTHGVLPFPFHHHDKHAHETCAPTPFLLVCQPPPLGFESTCELFFTSKMSNNESIPVNHVFRLVVLVVKIVFSHRVMTVTHFRYPVIDSAVRDHFLWFLFSLHVTIQLQAVLLDQHLFIVCQSFLVVFLQQSVKHFAVDALLQHVNIQDIEIGISKADKKSFCQKAALKEDRQMFGVVMFC